MRVRWRKICKKSKVSCRGLLKKTGRCAVFAFFIGCFFAARANAFVNEDKVNTSKGIAHYVMGHMYDLLGMNNRAILEYQKSVEFDESNFWGHLRLGTDYARLGMMTEAKDSLRRVYKYNPEDLQSHYLMALIHSSEKAYDDAAAEYEFILKSLSSNDPKNAEVYAYLGQLYFSQRKYDEAIKQFEHILTIDPKNADIMYVLASIYLEAKTPEKAIPILKQAIAVDPEHDGSLNTLSYVYAEQGQNLDEAIDLVNRALEVSPNNGAYLDTLGWVYYKKSDYPKAIEALHKAGGEMADPVIYEHIGDVYFAMANFEKAIEYWKMSLDLLPDQEKVKKKIADATGARASAKTDSAK